LFGEFKGFLADAGIASGLRCLGEGGRESGRRSLRSFGDERGGLGGRGAERCWV
jgi:hypothetical protein